MNEHEKKYWVGFNRIRGIGSVRTKTLLDYFGNLGEAWAAPRSSLEQSGLGKKITANFLKERQVGGKSRKGLLVAIDLEQYL